MDSSEEALSEHLGVILKYMAEPEASSSSDEFVGELMMKKHFMNASLAMRL